MKNRKEEGKEKIHSLVISISPWEESSSLLRDPSSTIITYSGEQKRKRHKKISLISINIISEVRGGKGEGEKGNYRFLPSITSVKSRKKRK